MKYRAEIDGLRSVAVLSVVFYHFKLLHFRGGFLGVDIFFVISGYLISFLLYEEVAKTGTVSFKKFWLRRARRILPALVFMLAVITPIIWYFLYGLRLLPTFSRSLIASLFSVSNFVFFLESGYFDAASTIKPLLHTWSLAVEEQFYLFFPLAVFLLLVKWRCKTWTFFGILLGGTLCSWLFCIVMVQYDANFAFFMLPTRLWEILAGAVLAFAVYKFPRTVSLPLASVAELAALSVLVYCLLYAPKGFGVLNGIVVLCTMVLLYPKRGIISFVFSLKPCVAIGKISYSLYLWHWPAVVVGTFHWLGEIPKNPRISLLIGSVICSIISYRFVEATFRKASVGWSCIVKKIIPVMLLLVCIGAAGIGAFVKNSVTSGGNFNAEIIIDPVEVDKDNILQLGSKKDKYSFILIGDSHAGAVIPVFAAMSEEYGISAGVISHGGMFIHPAMQRPHSIYKINAELAASGLEFIERNDVRNIFLVQYWSDFFVKNTYAYAGNKLENSMPVFKELCTEVFKKWLNDGRKVYVVGAVPNHLFKSIDIAAEVSTSGVSPHYDERNAVIKSFIESFNNTNLQYIDIKDLFMDAEAGKFFFVKDNVLLYNDNNHLNYSGAMLLRPKLESVMQKIASE